MLAHEQLRRPYAPFVHLLATAGVLLGLCSASGCEDKPAPGGPSVSPANPDGPGPAKHKRTPRTPK